MKRLRKTIESEFARRFGGGEEEEEEEVCLYDSSSSSEDSINDFVVQEEEACASRILEKARAELFRDPVEELEKAMRVLVLEGGAAFLRLEFVQRSLLTGILQIMSQVGKVNGNPTARGPLFSLFVDMLEPSYTTEEDPWAAIDDRNYKVWNDEFADRYLQRAHEEDTLCYACQVRKPRAYPYVFQWRVEEGANELYTVHIMRRCLQRVMPMREVAEVLRDAQWTMEWSKEELKRILGKVSKITEQGNEAQVLGR